MSELSPPIADACSSSVCLAPRAMLAQCTYELVSENPDVGGNSSGLDVSSSGLDVRSSGLEDDSTELHAIAAPVAGTGKASAAAVREAINQLCAGRYLTTESLGRLLNRNTENLRNAYLTPMVRNGTLRLRYAEVPNHPEQAYTSDGTPSSEDEQGTARSEA